MNQHTRIRAENTPDIHAENPKRRPPIVVTPELRGRFERCVQRTEGGCWEWTGPRHERGYGHFTIQGRTYRAHRVAFEIFKGVNPGKAHVCHACDNPPCVNPDHLWLGSARDNILDAVRKGRWGSKTPEYCRTCGHHRTDDYVVHERSGRTWTCCRQCSRRRSKEKWHRAAEGRRALAKGPSA